MIARARTCSGLAVALLLVSCTASGDRREGGAYGDALAEIQRVIEHELAAKGLGSVSIALVDGEETIWSRAFGSQDPARKIAATPDTVYRVGSISKLFAGIAVMQLVEQGRLDLDARVATYLPGYAGPTTTLRQILCHRSGMVREPPVGHYFDHEEPGLTACAESLFRTPTVYPPGTRVKYSNGAVSLAGHVVARVTGLSFAQYATENILEPLEMDGSAWDRKSVGERLAKATMWSYDGRTFAAPVFELGTIPAGNLYAPMDDLARFARAIIAGGQGGGGRILKNASLRTMLTPQLDPSGNYGVNFRLSELDGERAVGHGGAVYGFSTQLKILPDAGLAVAVSASQDISNTVVGRIADHALRCLMRVRSGKSVERLPLTEPVPVKTVREIAGRYAVAGRRLDLLNRDGRLFLQAGDLLVEIRADDQGLIVDDRHAYGTRLGFESGRLSIGGRQVRRSADSKPAPAPESWGALMGEYGWDHNVLFIYEGDGVLRALVEWGFDYPLTAGASPDRWSFPGRGLYHGEGIEFRRDPSGAVIEAVMAGMVFPRRSVGTPAGETFRIKPVRPVAELRRIAKAAFPPVEEGIARVPDLVELNALDPSIGYDIRYATTNNFMGAAFYQSAHALMQRPAAEALVRVHRKLKALGYGLTVFDAYRPWAVTKMFYDATPTSMKDFVADPSQGSRHNRGCAVDVTLHELGTGKVVEMVSGYDEFTERAYPYYHGGTSEQRWHRDLLRRVMESEGFTVYSHEWWHFDYKAWRSYAIMAPTFEEILN